jgi:hypothetical protein
MYPEKDYYWQLPRLEPDNNQYIFQLVQTVTTASPEKWNEYFTKWLMGVVVNALEDIGCQNHTCLVLIEEQGWFKTTWLDHLCPQSLKAICLQGR